MIRSWTRLATVLIVFALVGLLASAAMAQGRGRGGNRGGGIFGGGGGGEMALLLRPDVREELDLVDEQVTKLTAVNEKMQEEARAAFQDFDFQALRDLPQEERTAKFAEVRTQMEDRLKPFQKEADEILLPQQRKRLSQIALQQELRFSGSTTGLTSDKVKEALDIDEAQAQKITDLEQEVEKEMQEKLAKIREEAKEKILTALNPDQRAKFKDMIGPEFRSTQPQGRGGRQGGQPGQPGGRRGGNNNPAT
jgi:Spy/CpxP family protein refolding chaperone